MSILSKLQSLFSRNQRPSLSEAESIVDQLIALGFLKFTPESIREAVRQQLIESVQGNYLDSEWDDDCISADRRSYFADGEDLAEGGVGKCLLEMKEVLAREDVLLRNVEDDFGSDSYHVVVNREKHLIYENLAINQQNPWGLATKRLLEIVDLLLERAGSAERAFGIYCGGNDGRIILLTSDMHELLRTNGDIFDGQWMPIAASDLQFSEC
jgi:hypothetical protein